MILLINGSIVTTTVTTLVLDSSYSD